MEVAEWRGKRSVGLPPWGRWPISKWPSVAQWRLCHCVWAKALCAVGFYLPGCAGLQLKKRKDWTFLRKNVLQKSIINVISKAGVFELLCLSVSLCSEISAEVVVFLKGILSCREDFVTTLADWSYDGFWVWVTFSLGCPSFFGL